MFLKALFLMVLTALCGFMAVDKPALEEQANVKVGNKIEVTDEEEDTDEGIFLLGFELANEENEM